MTTYREGGDAKETRRADRPATEGNRESGLHPSPDPKPVPPPVYPDRAGGGDAASEALVAVGRTTGVPSVRVPPPALKVGETVEVHLASCESADQHKRVTVRGAIAKVYPDGAALALMADGSNFELCPWFTSDCPNAPYAFTERGEAA